tara:strand:- start:592 stop:1002 length:411 start_codon:yes stop_codon:yes gene_type:complete
MKEGKYVEAPFTMRTTTGAFGMTNTSKVYDASVIGVDSQGNLIHNAEGNYVFASNQAFGARTEASVIDMSDIIAHTQTNPLVVEPSGSESFLSPTAEEPPVANIVNDNSTNTNQPVTIINNTISSYDAIRFADTNT